MRRQDWGEGLAFGLEPVSSPRRSTEGAEAAAPARREERADWASVTD